MQVDTEKVMTHVTANWKTTAMGLSVCVALLKASVHFDVGGRLFMTQEDWFGCALALFSAVLGMLQQDAGTTLAQGSSGEVKVVDSHETPNDPADLPVVQR